MSIDVTPQTGRPLTDRVAEEIRAVMARRRYSGARLAKELGVSAAWVSYRLTGAQPIDLNDLERIAAALGVKIGDLLPRADREATVTYLGDHAADHPGPMSERPHGTRRPGGRHDPTGPGRATRVHPAIAA